MTGRRVRAQRVLSIVGIVLAIFGCSGTSPESSGAVAAAAQSKAPAKRNACQLVDKADMERLAKGKVTLLHNIEAAEQTNCEIYLEGKSDRAVIVLEVHWSGGKTLGRAEKKPAAGSASGKDSDLATLTAPGGGADAAAYSDVMAWVVKGDVLIKFTMPGLGPEDMRKNFVPLARKALAKLP
jgi:hypothetical protein